MSSRLNSDRNLRSAKEHFDLSVLSSIDQFEVSELSRRESRNRETHLPPLSTFRWWARRTGAVNEAILEAAKSVFGSGRLNVLDPFAGGLCAGFESVGDDGTSTNVRPSICREVASSTSGLI